MYTVCFINCRAGNLLISFLSESLVFCEKMSNLLKKTCNSLIRSWTFIFDEWPEQIGHVHSVLVSNLTCAIRSHHSFLVSNLSNLLTKNEGMSKLLIFKNKTYKIKYFRFFYPKFVERIDYLLIYHKWPEQITLSPSLVMSDLSDSLTVTHLS